MHTSEQYSEVLMRVARKSSSLPLIALTAPERVRLKLITCFTTSFNPLLTLYYPSINPLITLY